MTLHSVTCIGTRPRTSSYTTAVPRRVRAKILQAIVGGLLRNAPISLLAQSLWQFFDTTKRRPRCMSVKRSLKCVRILARLRGVARSIAGLCNSKCIHASPPGLSWQYCNLKIFVCSLQYQVLSYTPGHNRGKR